jgi:hypothetical protein
MMTIEKAIVSLAIFIISIVESSEKVLPSFQKLTLMTNKYKITGFARLLILMLFFAPIAYIGVSYYQGEDGIEKIKSLFEGENNDTVEMKIPKKKEEIKNLESQLEASQKDLKRLENETK